MEETTHLMEIKCKGLPLEGDTFLKTVGLENLLGRVNGAEFEQTNLWVDEFTVQAFSLNILSKLIESVDDILDLIDLA
jgi:hypothetical protein